MKLKIHPAILFLLLPTVLTAQGWLPTGTPVSDTSINSKYDAYQRVADDGNGGAYIAWYIGRKDKPVPSLFAQHISSDGNLLWDIGGITFQPDSAASYVEQGLPDLASNGKNGVYIAWQDLRYGSSHIFAQYLNPDGTQRWKKGGIDVSSIHYSDFLKTIPDSTGGVIVSFGWMGPSGYDEAFYVQRIDSTGKLLWGRDGIRIREHPLHNGDADYSIAADGKGGVYVAWTDGIFNHDTCHVWAQHVDSNGNLLWGTNGKIVDGNRKSLKYFTSAIPDGTGGVYLSWGGPRWERDRERSYLQRMDWNGNILFSDSGTVFYGWTRGKMVLDDSGGVYVYTTYPSNGNVLRFNNRGERVWSGPVRLVPDGYIIPWDTDIGMCRDLEGGVYIFFYYEAHNPSIWSVHVHHVNERGDLLFGTFGLSIGGDFDAVERDRPTAVTTGKGEAIVTWLDYRSLLKEQLWTSIYAAKINASGALEVESQVEFALPETVACYPDPAAGTVTVSFTIERSQTVRIVIYDGTGKQLISREVRYDTKGRKEHEFDIHGLHRGVYYVNIREDSGVGKGRFTVK